MMLVPGGEAPCADDATQLVLDIVKKVLDPVAVDPSQRYPYRPRQNYYVNANINYYNVASININYKRWSDNDCTGSQPANFLHQTAAVDSGQYTHEEVILRTAKNNKHRSMNFWDQYSSNASYDECFAPNINYNKMNNRSVCNPIQQQIQQQYLNNKYAARTSWRDNPTNNQIMSNIGFNQPHPQFHQQQSRTENSFYNHKKNMRKCCSFCRKNGESFEFYTSHSLYENGKPTCPVLRQCICNICGQSGHTMSHCSLNASKNSILKMIHRFNAMK